MTSSLDQFCPEVAAEVILIDGIAESPAHDDRDNVIAHPGTDQQRAAHRPQCLESGAVLREADPLEQPQEVLADRVISSGSKQAMLIGLGNRGVALGPVRGTEHQRRGLWRGRGRTVLAAVVNGSPHPRRQDRASLLPVLHATEHMHAAIPPQHVLGQGGTIIGSKCGEQAQKDLCVHIRVPWRSFALAGRARSADALCFGNDLPQFDDRPRSLAMLGVVVIPLLVEFRLAGRVEIVAIVRGAHEMLAAGDVQSRADNDDVAVGRAQPAGERLAPDLGEQVAGSRVGGRFGVEVRQWRTEANRCGQLLLQLAPADRKSGRRQLARFHLLLLSGEVEVDRIAQEISLAPVVGALAQAFGLKMVPPLAQAVVIVSGKTQLPPAMALSPVAAWMPSQFGYTLGRGGFGSRNRWSRCGKRCDNAHLPGMMLAFLNEVKHNCAMDTIPDKDEVGRSNRLGPNSKSDDNSGSISDKIADSAPPESVALSNRSRRTSTASGVVGGVTCLQCGRSFHVKPSALKRGRGRFCQRSCFNAWLVVHPALHQQSFVPESTKAQRVRAHGLINMRIRRGAMERPATCDRCGKRCRTDAHHDDYTEPGRVEFLCRSCHMKAHRIRHINAAKEGR